LKKRGCEIYTSSTVSSAKSGSKCKLTLSGGAVIESEKVLVSVGRTPDTDALGLDEAGVETVNRKIKVDDALRTGRKNVYAVGDCVDGPQLAHKASYDAIIACDNISGLQRRADYTNIPYCIWTDPQIASVGMSEEDARAKRADVKAAKFPYMASGKAYLEGKTEGFVKITGTTGGEILGVEILGAMACDLIAEAVLAKTMKINIRDWSGVIHGHPTISEVMQEAARAFCGYPIHSV
jgi:dihydrolipoamide dehydrogenase